jgi:hypothetical protein
MRIVNGGHGELRVEWHGKTDADQALRQQQAGGGAALSQRRSRLCALAM